TPPKWNSRRDPGVAAVTANLLHVPASCEVAHTYWSPGQISHYPCKTAARACTSGTLENLQVVEQHLSADSFDPVVANFAAHTLQAELPGISWRLRNLCSRFPQIG